MVIVKFVTYLNIIINYSIIKDIAKNLITNFIINSIKINFIIVNNYIGFGFIIFVKIDFEKQYFEYNLFQQQDIIILKYILRLNISTIYD